MTSPDWKKFEELAAAIQCDLAPEAKVTENAKLVGKSGTPRQIDILVEQDAGQFDLRIVVDCKDHKKPVDVKDVEAFLGLVDTANHKWRSYVSIPAVLRDFQVSAYSFSISWKGYGALDVRKDLRYLPIVRRDGSLIDYACNLVAARWEDETIPVVLGEHRNIPLVSEPTFLQGPDVLFEATI